MVFMLHTPYNTPHTTHVTSHTTHHTPHTSPHTRSLHLLPRWSRQRFRVRPRIRTPPSPTYDVKAARVWRWGGGGGVVVCWGCHAVAVCKCDDIAVCKCDDIAVCKCHTLVVCKCHTAVASVTLLSCTPRNRTRDTSPRQCAQFERGATLCP